MISLERTHQILKLLALGLMQQDQNREPVSLLNPYVKQAWEYICLSAYLHHTTPPQTLYDFVNWLHTPVENWEVLGEYCVELGFSGYVLGEEGLSPQFQALGEPLARTYKPHLELEDNYFRQIYEVCKQSNDEHSYTTIRTFLHQNPIHQDLYTIEQPKWAEQLTSLIMRCYEYIPSSCIRGKDGNRYIVTCPHCGWSLTWNKQNVASCHEDGVCAGLYKPLEDYKTSSHHILPYKEGMLRTKQGIQRYVVAPEVVLFDICRTLTKDYNIQYHLFPHIDSYDLLVMMPNGERWAVDLKDWGHAISLAIGLSETSFPHFPQWDRAFYIFPDYRADHAYLNEFNNYWIGQKDVAFMSRRRFIQQIREIA